MIQLPKQIGHIESEIPLKILVLLTVFFLVLAISSLAQNPPTDITLNKDNIDEHCPIGTLIGNFTAVDADGGTHFWSLVAGAGSSGNMSFDIPNGSSSLLSDEIFNYESQTSYTIRVQVRDENNATFSKQFTININDIDEANLTTVTSLDSEEIDEGNDIGDVVGTFSTTGVHAGTNHTFTFETGAGDDDNGSFTIDGDELKAAEVFDESVKNSYDIRIRSTSQEGDTDIETFTISVNSVNNEPTDISLTDNAFEETRPIGYRVGFLSTTDADAGEMYTYTLVAGTGDDDNANFSISGTQFKLATTFDYETQSTHSVRIQTDNGNGGTFEKVFAIDVEDDPEAPTDISLSNSSIDEENNIGVAIGSFTTEDEDIGDTHTYELLTISGSSDHTAFSISGDDLQAAVEFDFETQSSYTIRVRTEDAIGDRFTKDFVITINDIDEPIVWDGTAWSNGSSPAFADNVVIDGDYDLEDDGLFLPTDLTVNAGHQLTINGGFFYLFGDLVNNGGITVESGTSFAVYESNTITGNAILIRRTTRYGDGRYSMVGSPVGQNNSNTADNLGSVVYTYNETTAYGADGINRWELASTQELIPGKGYAQANLQNIFFIGTPNTGTVTFSGTYTEDAVDANEGWNLVANPYAAAIAVDEFLAENTNIEGAVYIWDDNGSNTQRGSNADYIVANGTMATNTTSAGGHTRYNQRLGSAQGFFVKLTSAADTDITFLENMQENNNNSDDNFFRKIELPTLRINLSNSNGLFKQAVVGIAEEATEYELNRAYDAQAFNASAGNGLFTMKAGRTLALNGMTNDWEVIQLQINTASAGIYEISVELEEYDQSLYLRDNLTGEVIDLRNQSYSFSTQSGIDTERFELLSNPSEVLGLETDGVFVYVHNSKLHIQHDGDDVREFELFNMNGKKLWSKTLKSNSSSDLTSLTSGIYLVFDGEKTHKIILD